ncbi:MAG: ATP-binding protein, partial [Halobaculum sp.]
TTPSRKTADDIELEYTGEEPLEVTMARAIRAVQIERSGRDDNEWVPVVAVDEEVVEVVDEDDIDQRGYDALPDVREASPYVEVDLADGDSTVMCRLTPEGEEVAEPDTSTVPTGGGDDHDATLAAVERSLATRGFSVRVLDQTSAPRPDAIATHPDLESTFHVEVETTTHARPSKVLQNLRKAQTRDRILLFVVDEHEGQPATDIADRLAAILDTPRNQLKSGETRLYTMNDNVKFNGGATSSDGVTAVRPATDDSRHTRWFQRDGDLVLEDGTGEVYTRISDINSVSKDQFPATYSYDQRAKT